MNYKSIVLSAILVTGLIPSCAFSMERQSVKAEWLSKAKLSEMAQQVTSSEAYTWASEHKCALLLGTAALITAGIAAYKYLWKQPTNEQIKEKIKRATLGDLMSYANNVSNGINAAGGRVKKTTPSHNTDYVMTVKKLTDQNNTVIGVQARYVYQCDKSTETVDILFEN